MSSLEPSTTISSSITDFQYPTRADTDPISFLYDLCNPFELNLQFLDKSSSLQFEWNVVLGNQVVGAAAVKVSQQKKKEVKMAAASNSLKSPQILKLWWLTQEGAPKVALNPESYFISPRLCQTSDDTQLKSILLKFKQSELFTDMPQADTPIPAAALVFSTNLNVSELNCIRQICSTLSLKSEMRRQTKSRPYMSVFRS